MHLSDGHSTGTMDRVDPDYFVWDPDDAPFSIHIRRDLIDALSREADEAMKTLARPVLETGGLLLGRLEPGERPVMRIDLFRRVDCRHKSGPRFVLDEMDCAGLAEEAEGIRTSGEGDVVGFYRSHLRDGFQLEESDFELTRRYFSDASDLCLLMRPDDNDGMMAQFFVHKGDSEMSSAGPEFRFVGRGPEDVRETVPTERLISSASAQRLIPDFASPPVEPPEPLRYEAPVQAGPEPNAAKQAPLFPSEQKFRNEDPPPAETLLDDEENLNDEAPQRYFNWKAIVPLLAALLLIGAGIWYFVLPGHKLPSVSSGATSTGANRPIGLSVSPMGKAWQVSWNSSATALHEARSAQLFVRDGDDQNRIDLMPKDLEQGMYRYESLANDLTFRLEVVERSGAVSAESFRFQRELKAEVPKPPAPHPASGQPSAAPSESPVDAASGRITEPKVLQRVPPVVAAGLRPRIDGSVTVDVRVRIDSRGRVISAAPVKKPRPGLDTILSRAAVTAARMWRFEPARQNGKPIPFSQTVHFVFEK